MIIEEQIEQALVDRIAEAAGAGFKHVDRIGMYDVDLSNPDTLARFIQIQPACLVEYGEDSATPLDQSHRSSMLEASIYVWIFVQGSWAQKDTSDKSNALGRIVKDALRGIVLDIADAQLQLDYKERGVGREGDLLLLIQRYTLKGFDHPI